MPATPSDWEGGAEEEEEEEETGRRRPTKPFRLKAIKRAMRNGETVEVRLAGHHR